MQNKVSQCASIDKEESNRDNPLVSIITPVLNGINYLEACIQSVLSQSYPNIEHIFVDGGSTDGTVDLLVSYRAKYPDRIRFISEPDKGAGEASNKGWEMAKGEIFGWLGSDDMSELDAIQTVVEFFRANPEAYFVFGDCDYINKKGEKIGKIKARDFDLDELINDSCMISTPAAFYRHEVVDKVGWFDNKGNDLDYLIRIGKVFPMHRIDNVLANFRYHEGSITCSETSDMWLRKDYLVSKRHGGRLFSPRARRYYTSLIIGGLRPFLGFTYHLIRKVLRK